MADAVDVVIAGGGPAGATLAILLGRAGLRVDLFEARRFPREKPCGEGMMPAGVAVLERLGLRAAVGGHPLSGVRYHGFGLTAASPFSLDGRARALAQRRLRLDDTLLAAARATAGVRIFEEAPVEGVAVENGRAVGLRVGGELRHAALVVGADGLDSPVRRWLGLERPARARGRVGVRMHFQLPTGRTIGSGDHLEIFLGRGHELYAAPLPDGGLLLAGLGGHGALAGGARATLDGWIAQHPLLRGALDGATPITAPAGRAPVTRQARAGFAPGAVLLGDAASATDPLTAGGIAHALVTAEHLAAAVPGYLTHGDARLVAFDRERRQMLRAHDWLTRALVFVVRTPALARATLLGMRAAPFVMKRLVAIAGGVAIQPPTTVATSSRLELAMSSATDQNATLSQRAGSE
ncbi:MAG TPA: FAD-dependent monooxygenase [Polyangia bacterium]|nr:FAD-dependent monooxygenase [Polyangia bacterium]